MRLTRVQRAAVTRLDLIDATGGTPEAVATAAAAALSLAAPWDGYRLFALDPATGDISRLLAASAHDAAMRQRWLSQYYQRDVNVTLGPFQHAERIQGGFRAIMIHERLSDCHGVGPEVRATVDADRFYRAYHEHRERAHADLRHLNAILVNFPVGRRWVATMQAYRIDTERAFTASDLAFLRVMAPRVGELIDVAIRREYLSAETRTDIGPGACGVIVIDRAVGVRYASPAGRAWLTELTGSSRDRETLLPASVWSAIAGIGADSAARVTTVPTAGGHVVIEASPGGSDGSVALVVSAGQAATEVVVSGSWGLTPAEERVATLAIRGRSDSEIAETLSVSRNTVSWHLRRVFERLGVHSRSQLTAHYFQTERPGAPTR